MANEQPGNIPDEPIQRTEQTRSLESFEDEGGAPEHAHATAAPRPESRLLPSDAFAGRVVLASNGQAIGTAVGVQIDTATWRVDSIEVKLNREVAKPLGLRRGVFRPPTVRIPTQAVQSVSDAIILSASITGLRSLFEGGGSVH